MTVKIAGYIFLICLATSTVILCTTAAFPLDRDFINIISSDASGITLEVHPPPPEIRECRGTGPVYTKLEAEGLTAWTSEEGKPRIPFISLVLGIPEDAKLSVSVISSEDIRMAAGRIRSNPRTVFSGEGDNIIAYEEPALDELTYSSSSPYPETPATAYPLGFMRSSYLGALHIYPYRYIPASGEIIYHKYMKIRVDFGTGPRLSKGIPRTEPETFESILSEALINYSVSRTFRRSPSFRSSMKPARGDGLRYRVVVKEDGLYRITWEDLKELEADLEGVDPRTIRLVNKGHDVPILVRGGEDGSFDRGDWIEFYGEYNRKTFYDRAGDMYKDPYTDENIYWLSWGGDEGMRLASESGAPSETDPLKYIQPFSYEYTVHAEEDKYMDRLGYVPDPADHWFWDSGIYGGELRSYSVVLKSPDHNSPIRPKVTAVLRGKTFPPGSPDHHALIYFNDVLVSDVVWDGQGMVKTTTSELSALSSSHIKDGINTLTVVLPADSGKSAGSTDAVYLNWFEVEYPRLYWTDEDYIEFSKPKGEPGGLYNFVIGGFKGPDVEIYKKGVSRITGARVVKVEEERTYYQITFQDEVYDDDVTYVVLRPNAKKRPALIEAVEPSDIRDEPRGADYIIITSEVFEDALRRLVDFREGQGLRVKVVDVQEIYDEFNYGIRNPEAIREFLRYAYENWPGPPPSFVLLAGDGTWDYKDIRGRGGNFVPPYLVHTVKWGSTASDHMYSCIIGDDLIPDILVGRLPAADNVEMRAVVDKIIKYETSPIPGSWRREALFIGGKGRTFREQSESLIANFVPPQFEASRLYVYSDSPDADPYFGGTQDLIDQIDSGKMLVNFMGHGGGAIWSDASLMRFEDVPRLHNDGKMPLVVSLTCFTSAFAEIHRSCLGEEFLKAEDRGAIGWIGSSTLGWLSNDFYLGQSFLKTFFRDGSTNLGKLMGETKLDYISKYLRSQGEVAKSIIHGYSLLGDPATEISLPDPSVRISVKDGTVPGGGGKLSVEGSVPEAADGSVELRLADPSGRTIGESTVAMSGGKFSAVFDLPDGVPEGVGIVRAYAWSPSGRDWCGAAEFSIGGALATDIRIVPESPTAEDTVLIYAKIYGIREDAEVTCSFPALERSIRMVRSEDGSFVTESGVSGLLPGTEVGFRISAEDVHGNPWTSRDFSFRVLSEAKLSVNSISMSGSDRVELVARLENLGEQPSSGGTAAFYLGDPDGGGMPLGSVRFGPLGPKSEPTFNVPSYGASTPAGGDTVLGSSAELSIPLPGTGLPAGSQRVYLKVTCDGESHTFGPFVVEVDRFNMGPEPLSVTSLDGNFSVIFPSESISIPSVLKIDGAVPLPEPTQPDFVPVRTPGHAKPVAYRLSFSDPSLDLNPWAEAEVSIAFDPSDTAELDVGSLAVVRWDETLGRWVSLGGRGDSGWISAKVNGVGTFALMSVKDRTPPSVELDVEGQSYTEGAFISPNPKISAVIHDANGVNYLNGGHKRFPEPDHGGTHHGDRGHGLRRKQVP